MKIVKLLIVVPMVFFLAVAEKPLFAEGNPTIVPTLTLDSVLVDDNFKSESPMWSWPLNGNSLRVFTNDGVRFTVPASATSKEESNAEIYNRSDSCSDYKSNNSKLSPGDADGCTPYQFVTADIRLRNIHLGPGSRGWGFWNGKHSTKESEIAWFIRFKGAADYPLNGFFAMSQRLGEAPRFTPIDESTLESWHNYTVEWTPTAVIFLIDGTIVANHQDAVPQFKMLFDTWINNVVYDPNTRDWILLNETHDTSVELNRLQIKTK